MLFIVALFTGCHCNKVGSKLPTCESKTGQCFCEKNIIGGNCDRCVTNHYGFGTSVGCKDCRCNTTGSQFLQCDGNGTCVCFSTTAGRKCDQCKENHFNFTEGGCR